MEAPTQTVKVNNADPLPLKPKSDFHRGTSTTFLQNDYILTRQNPRITPWAPKIDQILTEDFRIKCLRPFGGHRRTNYEYDSKYFRSNCRT